MAYLNTGNSTRSSAACSDQLQRKYQRSSLLAFVIRWISSQNASDTESGAMSRRHHGTKMEQYNDVVMGAIASQITSLTIVYSIVYSDADQRKHQSSASLAFVRWIHRWPVNSPHKWPVTRKMFPFGDVIMSVIQWSNNLYRYVLQ